MLTIVIPCQIIVSVDDRNEPVTAAFLAEAMQRHGKPRVEVQVTGIELNEPSLQRLADEWMESNRVSVEFNRSEEEPVAVSTSVRQLVALLQDPTDEGKYDRLQKYLPSLINELKVPGKSHIMTVFYKANSHGQLSGIGVIDFCNKLLDDPEFQDSIRYNLPSIGPGKFAAALKFAEQLQAAGLLVAL